MRYLKTENDYLQYLEEIDGKIINSASFPFGSVYFRVSNGTKLTFYLGSSNEPYKKEIFNLDFPISFNGEFYQNYADAEEVLGELFGSPSKELKDKVAEIEDNLNTALTNLENNTEDIEVLQDQMEQKADLSEVYTQERVDLLLNLKADNSTLQNQYYNKDTTDAKLALKSDKADTYNKADVNNLLAEKANINSVYNKSEVDIKLDEKADKTETYTKTEADNLLAEKADKSNTYTKTEVNGLLDEKADREYTYTKDEINGLLDEKANKEWTETEVSSLWSCLSNHQVQLDSKANANDVYTKTETDNLLDEKANYETIQGIEGSINNINDALSNHQSQLDNKADIDSVYGREYIDSHLNEKANAYELDGKQDTLVNQENIKSIQNHDILGEGNIELFSMMNQAEYDSLEEKDSNKLYLITDTHRVYYQDNLIIDGSATPTPEPEPTGETETHVIFYDENGDIIASLEGLSPYNITQSAVEGLGESVKENCRKVLFGYNVNSIGEKAFLGFDKVSEWTIQKRDTTEIGNFAFARTDNSTVRTFIFTNAVTPLNTETLGNNVFDRTNEGIFSLAADENTYFKVNGCDALFNLIDTLQNKDGYYSQYIERVSNLNDEECH